MMTDLGLAGWAIRPWHRGRGWIKPCMNTVHCDPMPEHPRPEVHAEGSNRPGANCPTVTWSARRADQPNPRCRTVLRTLDGQRQLMGHRRAYPPYRAYRQRAAQRSRRVPKTAVKFLLERQPFRSTGETTASGCLDPQREPIDHWGM